MPYGVLDPTVAAAAPTTLIGAPKKGIGLTVSSMLDEMRLRIGARADVDSGRLLFWLNLGYIDLCSMLRLDELQGSLLLNIVQGQWLYTLPSCVGTTIGASVADPTNYRLYGGRPLDKIDLEEWRRRLDCTGEIEAYFRHGDLLVVWPTPATAKPLALDFMVRPTFLKEEEDSPILPIEWHEGVYLDGVVKAYNGLEEPENELAADASFTKFVAKRQDKLQEEDVGRTHKSVVVRSQAGIYRSPRLPRFRS